MGTNEQHGFIEPMACESIASPEELPALLERLTPDAWIEPKLDGFRLQAHVDGDGVRIYTASGKNRSGMLPWVEDNLRAVFAHGTILDGEVTPTWGPQNGTGFEYVQSVMLSKQGRAIAIQRAQGSLVFTIFDALWLDGCSLMSSPLFIRRNRLLEYEKDLYPEAFIRLGASVPPDPFIYDVITDDGYEGIVVKDSKSLYHPGGRGGKGWYKLKKQSTVDVIICDFNPGEGKYEGQIGSIVFGQPNVTNGNIICRGQCSGMDDATRLFITNNMDSLRNTVIEVKHMGLMHGKTKFRHPQFVRFRPDKRSDQIHWHDA